MKAGLGQALSLRACMLYLLVSLFLVSGITLSRYVTLTNGGDGARVAVIRQLSITESGDFYEPSRLRIQPGVDLTKKAVVTFAGCEAAVYVFAQVQVSGWTLEPDGYTYTAAEGKLRWSMDSSWTFLSSEGSDAVYYRVLAPNEILTDAPLIRDGLVQVSDTLRNSEIKALPALSAAFTATVVQYDGFGDFAAETAHANAAWNAVKDR